MLIKCIVIAAAVRVADLRVFGNDRMNFAGANRVQ